MQQEPTKLSELGEKITDAQEEERSRSALGELWSYIVAGLLVAAPLGITWWICVSVFNWVDSLVRDHIKEFLEKLYPAYLGSIEYPLYGIGILSVLMFLIVLGMFARNVMGRQFIRFWERVLLRLPFVGWVYNAAQQISQAVLGRKKGLLQRVVLVQFPRRGIWTIAFVTGRANVKDFERIINSERLLFLFIPTTPNPTSGWLIIVPESETYPLDVTVDEGIKMVISGGSVIPPEEITRPRFPGDVLAEKHSTVQPEAEQDAEDTETAPTNA